MTEQKGSCGCGCIPMSKVEQTNPCGCGCVPSEQKEGTTEAAATEKKEDGKKSVEM